MFSSADRQLLVGHPVALQRALGVADVFAETAESLQARASAPMLTARRLLELTRVHNLTLGVDLKGADRPEFLEQLGGLARMVQSRQLEPRVWIWIESATQASALRRHLRRSATPAAPALFGGEAPTIL